VCENSFHYTYLFHRLNVAFIRKYKVKGRVYLAEVESKRIDGKVRQKVLRYLGVDPHQNKSVFPSRKEDLALESSRVFGSVIALDFIANELGLYALLGEHAKIILTLVFCHCHDYRSLADVERWFHKTDLRQILGVEKISEKQLRDALSALANIDQLSLQKSIFENQSKICGEIRSSVVYDVTNTYFFGKRCDLAKYGKNKENDRSKRVMQIGLAMTKEHGVPILHQVHRGNIHDSKIFAETIIQLKRIGFRAGTIVYDRGMNAKSSILKLSSLHWKIIGGMPLHQGIKSTISKMDFSELESFRNRIQQEDTVFYGTTIPYQLDSVKGKLLILLNPRKRLEIREKRLKKIKAIRNAHAAGKVVDIKMKKYFNKSGGINSHAIKRAEKYDGLSILFTTGKLSREDIVQIYFGKDLIEKAFQCFKGVLALRPVRHWLENNVRAHIMICYLAYVLLTTFRFKLNNYAKKSSISGISVSRALSELADTYRVYFYNREQQKSNQDRKTLDSKLVQLSSLQEDILKAISPTLIF